ALLKPVKCDGISGTSSPSLTMLFSPCAALMYSAPLRGGGGEAETGSLGSLCATACLLDVEPKEAKKVRSPLSLKPGTLKPKMPSGRLAAFSPSRVIFQLPSGRRTKIDCPELFVAFGSGKSAMKAISPFSLMTGNRKLPNSPAEMVLVLKSCSSFALGVMGT